MEGGHFAPIEIRYLLYKLEFRGLGGNRLGIAQEGFVNLKLETRVLFVKLELVPAGSGVSLHTSALGAHT